MTLNARPIKGKYIRWSLVTSAKGANDVGNNAAANQISPKAIGRVSFFADVLMIVTINEMMNMQPIIIRSSK